LVPHKTSEDDAVEFQEKLLFRVTTVELVNPEMVAFLKLLPSHTEIILPLSPETKMPVLTVRVGDPDETVMLTVCR
jgi:hypothetical protein